MVEARSPLIQSNTCGGMLHDALLCGRDQPDSPLDRRQSERALARAELVVRWHHDPDTAVRYRVLDISDGGVRILTATPLIKGMSGTAVKLLPNGAGINRPCSVCWVHPPATDGAFEAGLRYL